MDKQLTPEIYTNPNQVDFSQFINVAKDFSSDIFKEKIKKVEEEIKRLLDGQKIDRSKLSNEFKTILKAADVLNECWFGQPSLIDAPSDISFLGGFYSALQINSLTQQTDSNGE